MCNLFANTMPAEAMRRVFDVAPDHDRLGNQPPQPAIFPRDAAPVIRHGADGAREALAMHWGFLMPQTSKRTGEPILPKAVNNARDDKLRESPFWRESFERRRCLVPATAFCEAKGARPATYVWFGVTGQGERPPFAMAGLWRRWRGRYREDQPVELDVFTVVTTTPNPLVAQVHPDRMPVILPPEAWETWLSGDPDAAAALLRAYPADAMRVVRSGVGAKADIDEDPAGLALFAAARAPGA
jgi:putative SOS response-associated peptidase YedK